MYKVGWFSTGRGQGSLNLLHAIVKAIKDGDVNAKIAYVFCSRELGDAEGSDRYINQAQAYGLDLVTFSSKRFKPELRKTGKERPEALNRWRREYDREIMKRLDSRSADINVLAGYMLIVGAALCNKYDLINLHPASPDGPAGTWQEVIRQLIAQRAEQSGNMMHLVTEELDKGPPITYCTFSLKGGAFEGLWQNLEEQLQGKTFKAIIRQEGERNLLFSKIREESAMRELPLVIQTVRAFAAGRLRLEGRKIFYKGELLQGPCCLNEDIEKQLQSMFS